MARHLTAEIRTYKILIEASFTVFVQQAPAYCSSQGGYVLELNTLEEDARVTKQVSYTNKQLN